MRKLMVILALLLVPIIGCKTVEPGDLVGTWAISDESRLDLPLTLRKVSAQIVLSANGAFSASELPDFLDSSNSRTVRSESGHGVWHLVSREGQQTIQLNFQDITDWKDGLPYGSQLWVSRDGLSYFIGDPDEGHRVLLTRH